MADGTKSGRVRDIASDYLRDEGLHSQGLALERFADQYDALVEALREYQAQRIRMGGNFLKVDAMAAAALAKAGL